MKRRLILTTLLLLLITVMPANIKAQDLRMSGEFLNALEKGTRTINGIPGENYWTNSADYRLDVELVFENDTTWVKGSADIRYFNNSPDTLRMIVLRSYPDAYADAALRSFYIHPFNETRQVQYSDMIVDGDTIPSGRVMRSRTSTNLIVRLSRPVNPGASADLSVSWKYHMHPRLNIRQGVYDNESVFVAYWYPQVAVYDDVYGWDMIDYLGLVEFYNGFNNYDVNITLPASYFVWAGGVLQNPGEVYPRDVLKRYNKAHNEDEIISIISKDDLPRKDNEGKLTWRFKSEGTPDFTFAASKHHLWDASSLEVEEGRRVLVSAVYPPASRHYSGAAVVVRNAIDHLSSTCPAVPYPWPQMTVFNSFEGGGGMESPMMVNNGDQRTKEYASEVIFHEIAHSYVPFISGSNERRFSWLDEGWATYQGMKWSKGAPGTGKTSFDGIYQMISGSSNDLPLMVPSYEISDISAGTFHSYCRSAMALLSIEDQVGEETMNKVWNIFITRWQGKHPQPWDFFNTINEVAGEDLNWLIKPWYYDFAHAEIELTGPDGDSNVFTVTNKGGLPVPVYLTLEYDNGDTKIVHRKPGVWRNNSVVKIEPEEAGNIISATVTSPLLFDTDYSNNSWTKR